MIIKSMSRKSATFGQLLDYFLAPEALGPPLTHNLLSTSSDREGVQREFFRNAQLLPRRKNGNVLFHEILSFAAEDAELVTPALLEDLTRRYLELRAPRALGYAVAHFDTPRPHVHVLLSANNIGSRRRLRLPKQRFRQIQVQMEQVQLEQYPQLRHSAAQTRRSGQRRTRAEGELWRRAPATATRKEVVRSTLSSVLATSTSGALAYRQLLAQELRLYQRGQSVGVEDLHSGKRYRLRTLGLEQAFTTARQQWQVLPKQVEQLSTASRAPPRQLER